jgi:hypothetical protein
MVMTPRFVREFGSVAASAAPAAASGFSLSAERFHTVTDVSDSMSRCAIAAPIFADPAMPICIGPASCELPRTAASFGSRVTIRD